MTSSWREMEGDLLATIAEDLRKAGYQVAVEPGPSQLPFGLAGYRPDLIATRESGGLIIELKRSERDLLVERYAEVATIVKQHPGWRFLLMPVDRLRENTVLDSLKVPEWGQLIVRAKESQRLLDNHLYPSAFLTAWSGVEGLLRRVGEEEAVPVASLSPLVLIKQLYSQGLLSSLQLNELQDLMRVRNNVVHGLEDSRLVEAATRIVGLLLRLISDHLHSGLPPSEIRPE